MAESRLLDVKGLKTYFETLDWTVKAVDDISFQLIKGETLGIVGESGCGKSMTARSVLHLVPKPKGRIAAGTIHYYYDRDRVVDITAMDPFGREIRSIRGKEISMIFQEPMTALSPVYTIGNQIGEVIRLHEELTKQEIEQRSVDMLRRVGISSPEQRTTEYPHQFSGGMRQRVMIAIALVCNPKLVIADEPTTALDVTVEAQILTLLEDLQGEFGMSVIFISHDLKVIGDMADRVLVMYAGKIVEESQTRGIFRNPKHPYTQGLLESIPKIGEKKELHVIKGSVPNLKELGAGCYFAPRCPHRMDVCRTKEPPMFEEEGYRVKCWLYG